MATTGLYDKYAQRAAGADVDLVNARIVAALLDISGYSVDLAADEFLADLPGAAVLASVVLTGRSVGTKGAFDADDPTFASVASGASVGAVAMYKDTGFANNSPLIYYSDEAPELPITGDGDAVVIQWASPIFKLKA